MQKRNFSLLAILVLLLGSVFTLRVSAFDPELLPMQPVQILFETYYIDPTSPVTVPQKSPVLVPEVLIDNHTLIFNTSCDGCTLRLVNEDDEVDYEIVIPTNTNSLILPSTLEGNYEIQIVLGNWCFCGEIEL